MWYDLLNAYHRHPRLLYNLVKNTETKVSQMKLILTLSTLYHQKIFIKWDVSSSVC
jgi:AAA15 family ATPase/GTPase